MLVLAVGSAWLVLLTMLVSVLDAMSLCCFCSSLDVCSTLEIHGPSYLFWRFDDLPFILLVDFLLFCIGLDHLGGFLGEGQIYTEQIRWKGWNL